MNAIGLMSVGTLSGEATQLFSCLPPFEWGPTLNLVSVERNSFL